MKIVDRFHFDWNKNEKFLNVNGGNQTFSKGFWVTEIEKNGYQA